MSRWLFSLLLALNVLAAAWGLSRTRIGQESSPPPAPLPRVRLFPWDLPEPQALPIAPEPEGCLAVGPFAEQAPALSFLEGLDARGLRGRIRVLTRSRDSGYWVLIPAERVARGMDTEALAAQGVKDSWRFSHGPLAGALSLGLYARRKRAQARAKELAARGVQTEIRPRRVEQERYLVEIRGPVARLHSIEPPVGATSRPCGSAIPNSSPKESS